MHLKIKVYHVRIKRRIVGLMLAGCLLLSGCANGNKQDASAGYTEGQGGSESKEKLEDAEVANRPRSGEGEGRTGGRASEISGIVKEISDSEITVLAGGMGRGGQPPSRERDRRGDGAGGRRSPEEKTDTEEQGEETPPGRSGRMDEDISREHEKMDPAVISILSTTEIVNADGDSITAGQVEEGSMVTVETNSSDGAVKITVHGGHGNMVGNSAGSSGMPGQNGDPAHARGATDSNARESRKGS